MSLTLKLGSLAIRTLAKPLANYIKQNAREHERFRRVCIGFAQGLHKIDMRLRLGLLQDPAAIERQIKKEIAEAQARLNSRAFPTAKTEAKTKWDEERLQKEREKIEKEARKLPRVRPLSESKAIESGANFISESFLFAVATGIIVFEFFRSKRKEEGRRDIVKERLDELTQETRELKESIMRIQNTLDGTASTPTADSRKQVPKSKDELSAKPNKSTTTPSTKSKSGARSEAKSPQENQPKETAGPTA